jgi:hypothetical protein
MTKIHKLDIYQNAIDSLNIGIEMCERALKDESKYKFSIILITNFMELLLKKLVEMQNPLLLFEKPYSEKIDKEKTISWLQALQILSNSGKLISKKLIDDLKKLNRVRNEIIHYKFEYNVYEIDSIILTVIDGLRQLYTDISGNDLINDVQENTKIFLGKIKDDYLNQLHQAQFNAKDEAEENNMSVVDCNFCGESETAVERENSEMYCYFCDETDREEYCTRCTVPCLISEMDYFGENDYGDSMYFCQYCSGLMNED